ncbi:MAG: luciferase family protein [Planctomycetota bacterium]
MREYAVALPEASEAPSRFGGALAFQRVTGGRAREFAHLHGDDELDLRLPPAAQRALREDPDARPRASRSPWIAYALTAASLERACELLRQAYEAAGPG